MRRLIKQIGSDLSCDCGNDAFDVSFRRLYLLIYCRFCKALIIFPWRFLQ